MWDARQKVDRAHFSSGSSQLLCEFYGIIQQGVQMAGLKTISLQVCVMFSNRMKRDCEYFRESMFFFSFEKIHYLVVRACLNIYSSRLTTKYIGGSCLMTSSLAYIGEISGSLGTLLFERSSSRCDFVSVGV